jgi:hypothetical protein
MICSFRRGAYERCLLFLYYNCQNKNCITRNINIHFNELYRRYNLYSPHYVFINDPYELVISDYVCRNSTGFNTLNC